MNQHVPSRALATAASALPPETGLDLANGWLVPVELVAACPSGSAVLAQIAARRRKGIAPLATARVVRMGAGFFAWVYYPAPHGPLCGKLDVAAWSRLAQ